MLKTGFIYVAYFFKLHMYIYYEIYNNIKVHDNYKFLYDKSPIISLS